MHRPSIDRPRSVIRTLAGPGLTLLVGLALSACAPEGPESRLSSELEVQVP